MGCLTDFYFCIVIKGDWKLIFPRISKRTQGTKHKKLFVHEKWRDNGAGSKVKEKTKDDVTID